MKITQITFTRFVAAMAIVISHFNKDVFLYKIPYLSEVFQRANVGVSYFFILSGFIMIVAYHKKEKIGYADYYRNRFARIYPLYVVGLLLLWFTREEKFVFTDILLYLFGLQSWIPGKAMVLNFPGWSISVEFLFYLLFPFLYNYLYSKKNKSIWVITILIWITTQIFSNLYMNSGFYRGPHTESHDFITYFPLLHINEFLIGNLAGLFFIKNHQQKDFDFSISLIFIAILLCLIFVPLYFHNGLMGVLFIPLIILISRNNGVLTKVFALKPLEYLGEISYAIYITHIPVLYILRKLIWKKYIFDIDVMFGIYMVFLLLCSALFYQIIESPAREFLRKIKLK
ncbi:acyltransferase family protein [Chryseobacterium taiwanense]|uniref:acyltransferase family protein n=1 Tax=Chryseobacterium taiwanense TaxID=363331 RepID=UPI000AC5B606|nr:acyltransferase [Chryseobacterium taiwanense]